MWQKHSEQIVLFLVAVAITLIPVIIDRAEKYDAEQERIQAAYKNTPVHLRVQ